MYVVSIGNAFDGLSLVGPFEDEIDANDYADGLNDEWHIMELTDPPLPDDVDIEVLLADEEEYTCPFCGANECRTGEFVNAVVGSMG